MGWQKYFFSVVICVAFSVVARAENPKLVDVPLDKSFVPIGFDDNDKSQVTVAGMFPDACYKVGPYHIKVDESTKTVYVRQTAYYYVGWCLKILVPFSQGIDLGILREGNYTVKDQVSGKSLGNLPIARSKSSAPDDYLYAPVSDAYVRTDEGKNMLFIKGNFTDRCMKLRDVQIHYYNDVVVVQPIAEYTGTPHNCGHEMVRFQYEAELKAGLKGAWLLHVRSMDGQAINRIVEFE